LDFVPEALELGAVSVSSSMGEITLVACYRSPSQNNNIKANEWNFYNLSGLSGISFFGDDFILHGAAKLTMAIQFLILLIQSSIVSWMMAMFFSGSGTSSSCIDLLIVSFVLALKCEWRVERDNWRNDHIPITIPITSWGLLQILSLRIFKYNVNRMD